MRQLTASEASNEEMQKEREWCQFHKWWFSHENNELRKSCATGWAFHIWQTALKSKQGEV